MWGGKAGCSESWVGWGEVESHKEQPERQIELLRRESALDDRGPYHTTNDETATHGLARPYAHQRAASRCVPGEDYWDKRENEEHSGTK